MGFIKEKLDLLNNISSQQSFFMGAGWGVALTATLLLGVFMVVLLGTNPSSLTGKVLGEEAVGNEVQIPGANTGNQVPPTQPPAPPQPTADITKISPVTDQDYIRGNKNAKVTLIEYSDFQCPFCQRFTPTVKQILEEYDGQVRFVYRHFPLTSIHPQAQKSAEAAECAGEQGKFWEMHDKLFENQSLLSEDNYKTWAKGLGLNSTKFDECLDSGKYASKIQQQAQQAVAGGITGTPGTFVNDQLVKGAVPYESFKQIIDSLLTQ